MLRSIIEKGEKIVFFGGAGVSCASGIPDFRSSSGLYAEKAGEDRPEEMLSDWYLHRYPEKFFAYYKMHMIYPHARPNAAHLALAELERQGRLTAVITQNIDGLHQMAGSRNVLELHGSVLRNHCVRCGRKYPLSHILHAQGVPRCVCGGMVRPEVVLYGEGLDAEVFDRAEQAIRQADVLLVGGTSLTVHPAASLVGLFQGRELVIINKTPTPYDRYATHLLRDPIEKVFESI